MLYIYMHLHVCNQLATQVSKHIMYVYAILT